MNQGRWGMVAAILLGAIAVFAIAWTVFRGQPEVVKASKKSGALPEKTNLLARESSELLPKDLAGVYVSMPEKELFRVRPRVKRNLEGKEPGWDMFEETPGDGRWILYMVDPTSRRVERVQIAMRLPAVDAIEPHLQDVSAKLGPPSGVWDCPPARDALPTRRFTWLRTALGVMDSYLLLGESVSITQMITTREALRASIQVSRCAPVSPDRFTKFPALPAPGSAK